MKKILSLLTLLLCVASGAWATDYYTPTADEVIILNSVYSASATSTGYSTHSAVAWAGTASTSSKKAGDPYNDGAATSNNVSCFSVKGNGKGKNITLTISGVSKVTVYHESHSSRYVELRDGSKSGTLIGSGSASTYYTEVDLNGTSSYSIFFHGTTGTDDQDFNVYAIKLTKYVNKEISTEAFAGVKVNGTALTENAETAGYSISGTTITLTDVAYAVPEKVTLTNHITYTDDTEENKNVAVTFEATPADGYWTGTATIGTTEYTVKVPYESQSVTAVTINGSAISADDLATLTSTKSVTIDGSALNGIGMIGVTLSGGTTTVTRTFSGNDVSYAFTINGSDNYTVTLTGVKKTYTAIGNIVYYKKGGTAAEGTETNSLTANGITFNYPSKTFSYGSGSVTIGSDTYQPIKLSTGEAVTVTFPEGKLATKVRVYGWCTDGSNGRLSVFKESSESTNDLSSTSDANIFYANNDAGSIYPSVYEYELDNWESLYFQGSGAQPFIVMDFEFLETKCATPTIEVGDFTFADKGYPVTITSSNTLYVSTDGENYNEVTSPYTVTATATTTYYAKATADGLEDSEVAEKAVTCSFDSSKKFVAWVYTAGYGSASYAFATDPMVIAMQEDYNVVEVNYSADTTPSTDLNNADLIVCTEAMTGNKTMSNGMKVFAGVTPMIGLKAYNYTKGRWSWGTPANPSSTAQSFTPKSIGYKVLDGVSVESDGTIQLATATSGNVIQTVQFGTSETTAPEGNIILGTLDNNDAKAVMYASTKYFGLGLSSDCWETYTNNAITIVKNAAAMLIAGEDLDAYKESTITKTITAAGYATLYSEYPLDFTGSDLTAYIATMDGTTVKFSEVESVPANTGVLLKGEEGEKTITVAASTTDVTSNVFKGVLEETKVDGGIYVLMGATESNAGTGFYKTNVENKFTVGAHTAYLPANVAGARTFIGFDFEDNTTTGISSMHNSQCIMHNEVYNLNGQRVMNAKKGLYIVNGKKVIK